MRCIVSIKTSSPLDLNSEQRCEYLCRFGESNHFVSVIVDDVFPGRGVIVGNAQHLMGDIVGPMMGDVLGLDETDIRGWLLIL